MDVVFLRCLFGLLSFKSHENSVFRLSRLLWMGFALPSSDKFMTGLRPTVSDFPQTD